MRRILHCTLLVAVLLLSACEIGDPLEDVELTLDVPDAPVDLGAGTGAVQIRPGETTASTSAVENDLDVATVEELKTVKFPTSAFTYNAGAGKTGDVQDSGTITLAVFIDGVPVPGAVLTITVVDNAISSITPNAINVGSATIDRAAIEDLLDNLPPEQQPDLAAWQDMTVSQVVGIINDALAANSFPFTIVATATGDLSGSLKINQIVVDARVTVE